MLGQLTHSARGEADAQAPVSEVLDLLEAMEAPAPGACCCGGQHAQHHIALLVTPDGKALRQPCIDIPIVGCAAERFAQRHVAHPIEPKIDRLVVATWHLGEQVGHPLGSTAINPEALRHVI